jgi:hypothetical protein
MIEKFKKLFLDITEKEYRAMDALSYSLLSGFSKGGPPSLLEKVKTTDAMIFGTLVETLLFNEDFNAKFIVLDEKPTATLLKLANDALDMNVYEGEESASDVLRLAIDGSYWKSIKDEVKIEKKLTDIFWNYLNAIYENKINDKYIINKEVLLHAQHKVDVLRTHEYTAKYFSDENIDNHLFQLKGLVEINDVPVKYMADMVDIDFENKEIQPYDFKTGRENAENFESNFYAFKYYIQGGLYSKGLELTIQDSEFSDYKILPFKFIYISSGKQSSPIVKKMEDGWNKIAAEGWSNSFGYKSTGYLDLIDDVMWHLANEEFNYSRDTVENNGESLIKLPT